MRSLKILQLIQKPQFRGAELFACQLSNHLISQGHEVLMVCLYEGNVFLPYKGPIVYLQRPPNRRFFDISGWKKFSEIVQTFHPDVIQANAADTLKFAASSKFFYNISAPIIFRNANKMGDFINFSLKKAINKFYLSQVSMVLSVSKLCRKDFIKTFNFPKNKVKTIQIGIDGEERMTSNLIFEGSESNKLIVHTGSFVPEKNHSGLLRIFSLVLNYHPDAILLLIGKGHLEEQVKKQVIKSNLNDKVKFLGYRDDVLEIFKNSHCLVLPSLIEGLPGVLLEGMYCKLPVIAYNVGGISEIVTPSTGSLVEKNNEHEFVKEICHVLNERDEVKIDHAYRVVQKKFLIHRIAKKFAECYHTLRMNNEFFVSEKTRNYKIINLRPKSR